MKKAIKKIIPKTFIPLLKVLIGKFTHYFINLFSKSGFLSSLYYCFFSNSFYREHKAVLKGRIRYQEQLIDIGESSVLLRRNIHRVEKGLIMEPRRDIFATAYIEETLQCYIACVNSKTVIETELKWAKDVLDEYFKVVNLSKSKLLSNLFELYSNCRKEEELSGVQAEPFIPYKKTESVVSSITFSEITKLFKQRRSVRWYDEKPVELELIKKAIDIAAYAPSACNRQPFEFHLVTDRNSVDEIAGFAMGTAGFAENIPALIIVTGNLASYPYERDRHVIYIDASLATMQLMLAFETLGLSSCAINWPDIESLEQKMEVRLELEVEERPILLLSVGYARPDGQIPYSQKKNSELLLKLVD